MLVYELEDREYALVAADLRHARLFLEALTTKPAIREEKVITEALTLAAVVSYCRPFSMSRDASGKRRQWVPKELLQSLPARCRAFHERLLASRNQAWAHTDWAVHNPCVHSRGPLPPSVLSRNPWVPLESPEIEQFLNLIGEIDGRLQPASIGEVPNP